MRQKWNSHLESDREVCAVLAAVTESIAESVGDNDSQPSPTAYWAALMTTLECAGVETDDKAITAVIYLLSMVSPYVCTLSFLRYYSVYYVCNTVILSMTVSNIDFKGTYQRPCSNVNARLPARFFCVYSPLMQRTGPKLF